MSKFSPEQNETKIMENDSPLTPLNEIRMKLFKTPGFKNEVNAAGAVEPVKDHAKPLPIPRMLEKGDLLNVALRIRPLSALERTNELGKDVFLQINDDLKSVTVHPPRESKTAKAAKTDVMSQKFSFNKVYHLASQKEIFDERTLPLVQKLLNGEDCLQFTYGVTNSGKTYTVQVRKIFVYILKN